MGFFNKRRGRTDTIDFTEMQKRQLLKREPEARKEKSKVNLNQESMNFGFLGNLASAADSNDDSSSITSSLREARQRNLGNSDFREMKIKLEDTEFKLSNLADKVRQLEEKIKAFEDLR